MKPLNGGNFTTNDATATLHDERSDNCQSLKFIDAEDTNSDKKVSIFPEF
jgi:hypothetical protein